MSHGASTLLPAGLCTHTRDDAPYLPSHTVIGYFSLPTKWLQPSSASKLHIPPATKHVPRLWFSVPWSLSFAISFLVCFNQISYSSSSIPSFSIHSRQSCSRHRISNTRLTSSGQNSRAARYQECDYDSLWFVLSAWTSVNPTRGQGGLILIDSTSFRPKK